MSDKCETFVARWDHAMCSTCGAAHAPTPTPAPGLDLDAVERAERAMTPGPWHGSGCSFGHGIVQRTGNGSEHGFQDDAPCSFDVGAANAAGIVALRNAASALRNAASALIAEVRRLRAQVDADRRAYLDVCDAIAPETSGPADAAAKVRALRAKLADAKRLGMEACEFIHGAIANAPDPMSRDLDDRAAIAAGHNIADRIAAALEAL